MLPIYIKIYLEHNRKHSSVKITLYADRSTVHIHDIVHNRKPQSGASVCVERDCSTR